MEWKNGFTARYYYTVIDVSTWCDKEQYELKSGNVSKTTSSLMESADIDITTLQAEGEVWIRIWLDAIQKAGGEGVPIFTGLMAVPETEWDGYRKVYKAECYSVLKPANDVLLPKGWYISAGANGADAVEELLIDVGPAPITKDAGSPALSETIIAGKGETNLSMAIKILNAIGWRLRITGDGTIQICQKAEAPAKRFDAEYNDVVELNITDTKNWFSCPNVFRATSNGKTAIARDDSETSQYSTVSRGREVWMEEDNCNLAEGESISEYAARRLREEQSPARICNYARRFFPDIYPGDVITLHYPAQNIDGNFRIRSQQIELGYNARTEEESEELVPEG